jgi:hypothetical protein
MMMRTMWIGNVGGTVGSAGLWAASFKTQTTYFPFVYRKMRITIFAIITP